MLMCIVNLQEEVSVQYSQTYLSVKHTFPALQALWAVDKGPGNANLEEAYIRWMFLPLLLSRLLTSFYL